MKKIALGFLVFLLTLISSSGILLAKEGEEVKLTVGPIFCLMDQDKLEKFNAAIPSDIFKPFEQKVFPGIVINTLSKLPQTDLLLGSNTLVAIAVSENEEKVLAYAAASVMLSLEKPLQLTDKFSVSYGGALGYGISALEAQFYEDANLEELLREGESSEAYEWYVLTGLKGSVDYQINDKIALTCQGQYLLPLGSFGTEGFNLPVGGPTLSLGLSFLL